MIITVGSTVLIGISSIFSIIVGDGTVFIGISSIFSIVVGVGRARFRIGVGVDLISPSACPMATAMIRQIMHNPITEPMV